MYASVKISEVLVSQYWTSMKTIALSSHFRVSYKNLDTTSKNFNCAAKSSLHNATENKFDHSNTQANISPVTH